MAKPTSTATLDTGNALYASLLAVWAFLEGSGTTAADKKGTNTLTLSSSGLWSTSGSDPVIAIGTATAAPLATAATITFDGSVSWTIAWRAKQTSASNNGMIIGNNGDTNNFIWFTGGNTLTVRNSGGTDKVFTGSAGDTTTIADWVVAYTQSSGTTGTLSVYRNGTQVGSTTGSVIGSLSINCIGNAYTSNTFAIVGEVDYVYVWSGRALSSAEASTLGTAPYALFGSSALAAGTAATTATGNGSATVTCTAATGGTPAYSYQWYRSTTSGFTPGVGNLVSGATALTLNDSGLTNGVTYYYKLVVTDSATPTPATATSNQTAATPNNILSYDITDTSIGGVYVQVEGGATLGTWNAATAWGTTWNDGVVRFRATCMALAIKAYLNGGPIRLSIDGVDQGAVTILGNTSAYDSGYTTIATGLDGTAEHTYLISFGQAMYLQQIQTTGGTGVNTARLPVRPVLLGYGDSITAGDNNGTPVDSTVSWLHKAGLLLNYQVVNRGVHSSTVVGTGSSGQARTADVTGQLPPVAVCVLNYGTNDVAAGTSQGTYGAAYLAMLQQIQAGNPSCVVVNERLMKLSVGDTTRDPYSATLLAQVLSLNNSKFIYKAGMYTSYDGSSGVHPTGSQCIAIAAAVAADVRAALGGVPKVRSRIGVKS